MSPLTPLPILEEDLGVKEEEDDLLKQLGLPMPLLTDAGAAAVAAAATEEEISDRFSLLPVGDFLVLLSPLLPPPPGIDPFQDKPAAAAAATTPTVDDDITAPPGCSEIRSSIQGFGLG